MEDECYFVVWVENSGTRVKDLEIMVGHSSARFGYEKLVEDMVNAKDMLVGMSNKQDSLGWFGI